MTDPKHPLHSPTDAGFLERADADAAPKETAALIPLPIEPFSAPTRHDASWQPPALIAAAGEQASRRFLEFFTVTIRNPNTRAAYAQACGQFFAWCEERRFELDTIEPMVVAAYIEQLGKVRAPQTVKQHLAAIRMLFDWLVTGQVLPHNPAHAVRGPRYSIKKGKTPVLDAKEARALLDSIGVRQRFLPFTRTSGPEIGREFGRVPLQL